MLSRLLLILSLACSYAASNAQSSSAFLDSVDRELKRTQPDSSRLRLLVFVGRELLHEDPSKAATYFSKAYAYSAPNSGAVHGWRARAAKGMSDCHEAMGKLPEARAWLSKAATHAQYTQDPLALNDVWQQLSNYHQNVDHYDSALFYGQRMINLWDSLKRPDKLPPAYYAMFNVFSKLGLHAKALTYLRLTEQALIKAEGPEAGRLLSVYASLAGIKETEEQWDSVLYYCKLAYPIMKRENALDHLADLLAVRAGAQHELKQLNQARLSVKEGLSIAKANELGASLPRLLGMMAILKADAAETDSAIWYAQQCEEWQRKVDESKGAIASVYSTWASVYQGLGNYRLAYEYKAKELAAFNEYRNEELGAVAARNEVQFATAKKEATIQELTEVTAQQRQIQWLIGGALLMALAAAIFAYRSYRNKKVAADLLTQSVQEKEVFLREIHHRVKNNLQIISSLLYMQFKNNKDEVLLQQLKQAQDRIKSMALVHNKLYETKDVVHVYLADYIKDLAAGILQTNTPAGKEISLDLQAEDNISLSLDTSISVGLILNELITNSCKYAFGQQAGGKISIAVRSEGGGFQMVVKDDGSGLPADYASKNSLGLKLVNNLARQLGGKASFGQETGTVVHIFFKDSMAA